MFDFVKTRYTRWQRYSRTKSELEGLSNRELADLGIIAHRHSSFGARSDTINQF